MESYSLLEKLKETIKRDFQDLEERYAESDNRIQSLEKQNTEIKELVQQLRDENTILKESLAKVRKELAYKDEKLKRKYEELGKKEQWWDQFRDETQRRFKAMKSYGTFPPHILEKYVNKDIFQELINNAPASSSLQKEDHLMIRKKNGKLSTLKSKKKVRYNKVSPLLSQSTAVEGMTTNSQDKDKIYVSETEEKEKLITEDDEVCPDTNESTKLYHYSPPDQRQVGGVSAQQEVLVPETEDVYTEEVGDGFSCSIGAPSATSTPRAAASSLPFDYDSVDNRDDDNGDDVSVGVLDVPKQFPQDDTVDILTNVKSRLANLPKSDSQFPVDLSYTQPESPTIPSRTCSLQQDMNLTADCSVFLLPHEIKTEEKQEGKHNFDSKMIKDNDKTGFVNEEMEKQPPQLEAGSNCKGKATKQTTLDTKFFNTKGALGKKDFTSGKRKRGTSMEWDEQVLSGKMKDFREEQPKALFKVPMAPLPKTPEVILLEEFPSRGADKKSCTTPLGSSGDITGLYASGMDLFGNIDENCTSDLKQDSEKEGACLEDCEKENSLSKIEKRGNETTQENRRKDTNECLKPMGVRSNDAQPNYKYVEVVRKKDERVKLNGYKCRDCQEYYQGLDLPEDELKKRLKHCSRHRARFSPPPSTPPGFWNLSFPDTQEYMDKGYLKTESEAPAPKRLRKTRRNRIAK